VLPCLWSIMKSRANNLLIQSEIISGYNYYLCDVAIRLSVLSVSLAIFKRVSDGRRWLFLKVLQFSSLPERTWKVALALLSFLSFFSFFFLLHRISLWSLHYIYELCRIRKMIILGYDRACNYAFLPHVNFFSVYIQHNDIVRGTEYARESSLLESACGLTQIACSNEHLCWKFFA